MQFPNLNFYNTAQLTALKDAVIAERLRRVTGGTITQGSKNGKSFSIETCSEEELSKLENALAKKLGLAGPNKRRINFNNGIAGRLGH